VGVKNLMGNLVTAAIKVVTKDAQLTRKTLRGEGSKAGRKRTSHSRKESRDHGFNGSNFRVRKRYSKK